MSDIKSAVSRVHSGRNAVARGAESGHTVSRSLIPLPRQTQRDVNPGVAGQASEASLISEFIAPPGETAEWLGSPTIGSVLAAVSNDLAPDGVATSKRDQYVASVVETHLVARRQLAKHLNALLRA